MLKTLLEKEDAKEHIKRESAVDKISRQGEKSNPLKCFICNIIQSNIELKRQKCPNCYVLNQETGMLEFCENHPRGDCERKKCDFKDGLQRKAKYLEPLIGEYGFGHQGDGIIQYLYKDPKKDCCRGKEIIFGKEEFDANDFKYPDLLHDGIEIWKIGINKKLKQYQSSCKDCESFGKRTAPLYDRGLRGKNKKE